jgi:two-component system, NarL family, sensor histidine kinase BarA
MRERTMNKEKQEIIHWETSIKLAGGNSTLAKELLMMFMASLDAEIHGIQSAYDQKDYHELKNIIHKLHGGVSYCGLPALKYVINEFEIALKSKQAVKIDLAYKQFMNEISQLKENDEIMTLIKNK